MRLFMWAAAGLMLAACAAKPSVSEFQCKAGDWQTIGLRDGATGAPSSQLLAHQDACGDFNIIPDREAYLLGWQEGVVNFCTAANGFDLGERGVGHNRVCTGNLKEPFASAYADGRQLYRVRNELTQLERRLAERRNRLQWLKDEMTAVAAAQLNPDLGAEERIRLVNDLHSLAEERGEVKAQIPSLQQQADAKEMELQRVTQLLAEVAYP